MSSPKLSNPVLGEIYYRVVTIDFEGNCFVHIMVTQKTVNFSRDITRYRRFLLAQDIHAGLFALSKDGKLLFSGGHWDNSLRVSVLDREVSGVGWYQETVQSHKGRITCLSLSEDFGIPCLVTGSEDTTLHVWELLSRSRDRSRHVFDPRPKHILYGHNDHVLAVVASTELNVVISTSPGLVVIHNLRKGEYIRRIVIGRRRKNDKGERSGQKTLLLSHLVLDTKNEGSFVVYSSNTETLYKYSINGKKLLPSKDIESSIVRMMISRDGKYLITGGLSTWPSPYIHITRTFFIGEFFIGYIIL